MKFISMKISIRFLITILGMILIQEVRAESSNWVEGRWHGKTSAAAKYEEFAKTTLEDIGQDLVNSTPSDITSFAPNYKKFSKEKRLNFWVYLLSTIAERESSFRPKLSYTEDFNDITGTKIISRGLFQLSFHSAKRYENCDISSGDELYDPKTNIECAVAILNNWVVKDNVLSGSSNKGGARYWSVLRGEKANRIKVLTKPNF